MSGSYFGHCISDDEDSLKPRFMAPHQRAYTPPRYNRVGLMLERFGWVTLKYKRDINEGRTGERILTAQSSSSVRRTARWRDSLLLSSYSEPYAAVWHHLTSILPEALPL